MAARAGVLYRRLRGCDNNHIACRPTLNVADADRQLGSQRRRGTERQAQQRYDESLRRQIHAANCALGPGAYGMPHCTKSTSGALRQGCRIGTMQQTDTQLPATLRESSMEVSLPRTG